VLTEIIFVAVVLPRRIMFEIAGYLKEIAKEAYGLAAQNIYLVKTKFIVARDYQLNF